MSDKNVLNDFSTADFGFEDFFKEETPTVSKKPVMVKLPKDDDVEKVKNVIETRKNKNTVPSTTSTVKTNEKKKESTKSTSNVRVIMVQDGKLERKSNGKVLERFNYSHRLAEYALHYLTLGTTVQLRSVSDEQTNNLVKTLIHIYNECDKWKHDPAIKNKHDLIVEKFEYVQDKKGFVYKSVTLRLSDINIK